MNRRGFLERVGRGVSVITLGALSGYLVLQRNVSDPASCDELPFCKGCGKVAGCQLPRALAFRKSQPAEKRDE